MPDPIDVTFSEIVQKNGLATAAEIEECLEVLDYAQSKGIKLSLADVMVEKGLLNRPVVEGILREQVGQAPTDATPRLRTLGISAKEDAKLANLVSNNRLVGEAEFDECVGIKQGLAQVGHSKFLTEILAEKSYLRDEVVQSILEYIRSTRAIASPTATDIMPILNLEDIFFAALSIVNRIASRTTVQSAMAVQRQVHARCGLRLRLGEVMVEKKIVSPEALTAILEMQQFEMELQEAPAIRLPRVGEAADAAFAAMIAKAGTVPAEQATEAERIRETLDSLGIERRLSEVWLLRGFLTEAKLNTLLDIQKGQAQSAGRRQQVLRLRKPALIAAGVLAACVLVAAIGRSIIRATIAPPVEPGPAAGTAGPLTPAEADALRRQADDRAREYAFSLAAELLAKVLQTATDEKARGQLARRMEEWTAQALALDALATAVAARKEPPTYLTLTTGARMLVVRASRTGVTFSRGAAEAADSEWPWRQLSPIDLANLLELYDIPRAQPLGVASLCRDHGLLVPAARKALAVLVATPDFSGERVAEWFSELFHRPVAGKDLVVRGDQVFHLSESATVAGSGAGSGTAGTETATGATPGGAPGGTPAPAETDEARSARMTAAAARAAELARDGGFAAAAAALQDEFRGAAPNADKDPLALRMLVYGAIAGLQERLIEQLNRAPLDPAGKEFEELGVKGALVGANAEGLRLRGSAGESVLAWGRLTGAALERACAHALRGLGGEDLRALALWMAQLGDAARARATATRAQGLGIDLAPIAPILAEADARSLAKVLELLLDEVAALVERRQFEAALDQMPAIRAAAVAAPEPHASEVAWLSSLVAHAGGRFLCERALNEEKAGRLPEAVAALERVLRDCQGTPYAQRAQAQLTALAPRVKAGESGPGVAAGPDGATPEPGGGAGKGPPPGPGPGPVAGAGGGPGAGAGGPPAQPDPPSADPPKLGTTPPASLATSAPVRKLWIGTRTEAKTWWRYETPRYGLLSEEGREDRLKAHARLLEAARARANELLPPIKKDAEVYRAVLFATKAAYTAYGGPAEDPAWLNRERNELITWTIGESDRSYRYGPLLRSAWHQYLATQFGRGSAAPPAWIEFGMGEVFGAARTDRGDRLDLDRKIEQYVDTLREQTNKKRLPALEKILGYGETQVDAEHVAALWAVARFLFLSPNPRATAFRAAYLQGLRDGELGKVLSAHFAPGDPKGLEAAWQEFVKSL